MAHDLHVSSVTEPFANRSTVGVCVLFSFKACRCLSTGSISWSVWSGHCRSKQSADDFLLLSDVQTHSLLPDLAVFSNKSPFVSLPFSSFCLFLSPSLSPFPSRLASRNECGKTMYSPVAAQWGRLISDSSTHRPSGVPVAESQLWTLDMVAYSPLWGQLANWSRYFELFSVRHWEMISSLWNPPILFFCLFFDSASPPFAPLLCFLTSSSSVFLFSFANFFTGYHYCSCHSSARCKPDRWRQNSSELSFRRLHPSACLWCEILLLCDSLNPSEEHFSLGFGQAVMVRDAAPPKQLLQPPCQFKCS